MIANLNRDKISDFSKRYIPLKDEMSQTLFGGAPGQMNPVPQSKTTPPDMAMIIVMIIVLAIILLFCFWGAPGIRAYCRRKICSRCPMDEPRERSGTPGGGDDRSTTPTIILLPFGRMLVVDRTVITQLQADQTGIDFMELSANLIRAHHLRYSSTPSILDSDTTSKGLSPISLGYSPPSYDDIFGGKTTDLPPSYSELSLLFRQRQMESNELRSFNFGSMTARDKETVRETILDMASESMKEQKEIQSYGEIAIAAVPSNFQENDLPLNADSISVVNEDVNYSKYKYGVMMLGSDRSARIKCYCCEDSTHAKTGVSGTRSADDIGCSSSARREIHNNSECSIRTIEVSAMDHNTFTDVSTDYGRDSTNPNNYSKCTLNHSYSNEETRCKRSCEEIRESRL